MEISDLTHLKGKLIVFCGIDAGGKSTQIEQLIEGLTQAGIQNRYIWVRGDTRSFLAVQNRLFGIFLESDLSHLVETASEELVLLQILPYAESGW